MDTKSFNDAISHFEKFSEKKVLTLLVLGDLAHFEGSVLGKISSNLFSVVHVDTIGVPKDLNKPTAWIKWSPWSKYKIPKSIATSIPNGTRVINNTHFNCAKSVVQSTFERVFGFPLRVDPATHKGKAVKKSNLNATHDGQVVLLPQTHNQSEDAVYERLIDNSFKDFVCDIRIPIILGVIPFVYLKFRSLEQRFSNDNTYAKILSPFDVLTIDELRRCISFCSNMGLDYGEIDALRDVHTGELFIVDANNTPYGPPNHLSADESDVALRIMSTCVINQFFKV